MAYHIPYVRHLLAPTAAFLALLPPTTYATCKNWETYNCEYMDIDKDISLTGRCHKQEHEINGNFAYVLTWPSGNKVTVEYVNMQSGHHIWKINNKPAAAIELNREHLKGFSLDLNQLLEWQDSP